MVQTRHTLTAVMLASSESVVIMEWRVMVHLCRKILNHSGHKSVQQSVKADANVILDTIVIQIGECTSADINWVRQLGPSDSDEHVNLFFYFSRQCVQMHQCTYYGFCGENEYWNECGSDCKEDKCSDLLNPYVNQNNILGSKTCSAACEQRCQCMPGFFRNDDGKIGGPTLE